MAKAKAVAKSKTKPVAKAKPVTKTNTVAKGKTSAKTSTKADDQVRYSDDELNEFKELIQKKLDKSKKELEILTDAFSHKDGNNTDDTSPTFKLMEDGAEITSKEEIGQLAARQKKFIDNLELALLRIQNKTYGICRVTGKLIPKERLRAVPHATLSMEAKMAQNSSKD
jgi:DnaK suppressor protein